MLKNATLDDPLTVMKAAGALTASAAGSVVVDLGAGFMEGQLIIDVTALEVDTTDEIYDIVFQLSPDLACTVTTLRDKCSLSLGAAATKRTDSNVVDAIGRYILPVDNLFNGTVYQYARLYTVIAGTISTGINYYAKLCKR